MIPVATFTGKTVAVFGLGGSGLASCRALMAGGADVIAFDDDAKTVAEASSSGIPVKDLRELDWSRVAALVLAPGVPLTNPTPHWSAALALKSDVEIIGDIELFCRERRRVAPDCPFVAITGTNGKSTTTALIAHILRTAGKDVQMGGNIGVPILALEPPAPDRIFVIECSSYQIDLAPTLDPTVGIMLNVTPDHLDRHGTMERYAFIKSRVAGRARIPVVGIDDDFGRDLARDLAGVQKPVIAISTKDIPASGYVAGQSHLYRVAGKDAAEVADLAGIGSLRGMHNAQNAMAAFAACSALGLSDEAIRAGLKSFPGLAHRMEEIGRKGKVLFVNDSKATNADSAARALSSFNDIFWIAGGKPKEGGIRPLVEFFPRIRKAYLIGEAAADFAQTLDGHVPYEMAGTLDRAVTLAARDAENDSSGEPVVLLSPACASFDQFRNFEVRGDAFRDLVRKLLK
ncbi:MAG: UDP-N-acetylmuramoyl-L-alanine--D-glutamate ligase [Pseudorhodoplanes sp.]